MGNIFVNSHELLTLINSEKEFNAEIALWKSLTDDRENCF